MPVPLAYSPWIISFLFFTAINCSRFCCKWNMEAGVSGATSNPFGYILLTNFGIPSWTCRQLGRCPCTWIMKDRTITYRKTKKYTRAAKIAGSQAHILRTNSTESIGNITIGGFKKLSSQASYLQLMDWNLIPLWTVLLYSLRILLVSKSCTIEIP